MKHYLIALTLLLLPTISHAQGHVDWEARIENSKQLMRQRLNNDFQEMDINSDNIVTEEEFLTYRIKLYTTQQKGVFQELDTEHNQAITKEQYIENTMHKLEEINNEMLNSIKQSLPQ